MSLKIKETPNSERPYEKLEMYGPESLSTSELLAIIIKSGTKDNNSIEIAKQIINLKPGTNKESLRFLQDISLQEYMSIKGIGKVKAIQIKAVCELAKRIEKPLNIEQIKIKSPEDVSKILTEELRYEKREIAKVIILDTKNIIKRIVNVSYGGTNFVNISPKEVLIDAIKMNLPKVILVHNHPSGDPTPSKSDYIVTDRIYEATQLLGIEFLDHIIIGDGKFESILSNKKFQNIIK